MIQFADLFIQLDRTNATNEKVHAIANYFVGSSPEDMAWAVYILSGRRLKRLVSRKLLKEWLADISGYPLWMIDECYNTVGDFAEVVSLLSPDNEIDEPLTQRSLTDWMTSNIKQLSSIADEKKREYIQYWWLHLPKSTAFLVTKLITGALRVGVSQGIVAKALHESTGIDRDVIVHRLMGDWQPNTAFIEQLTNPDTQFEDHSRPYPFFLASPLTQAVDSLGDVSEWQAEWKWDGIRAQLIKRQNNIYLWSRGEDLVSDQFPEIIQAAEYLPDGVVLDGEILPVKDDKVLNFGNLQKRLGRKTLPKKLLNDVPVQLRVYDCLELQGHDIRSEPLHKRRATMEAVVTQCDQHAISASAMLDETSWDALREQREQSRALGVEGLMLKHISSVYETGRKRGHWWKWKIDPLTVDAVMIYAQSGSGRRATLHTDYTFAVWQGDTLLPLAKAYSGLTDKEINRLDKWIRANTLERFGPVRSVKAEQVFELAFEGIGLSSRHKSGVALRFPRILRWREDLSPKDADTLDQVKQLIEA